MKICELYEYLDGLIPRELSCSWDNDGLMVCGDKNADIGKILLSLDATLGAIEYAKNAGCNVIITHHPLIFKPVSSVSENNLTGKRIITSLKYGITVMSFHTRLDAVSGGVNDAIADIFDADEREILSDEGVPIGRIFTVDEMNLSDFAGTVKEKLDVGRVIITDSGRRVRRVAVVGGDGKDFIVPALDAGADTLLTGRCGYNADIDAADCGINIVEAGHFNTENPVLDKLKRMISDKFPSAEILFYNSDSTKII